MPHLRLLPGLAAAAAFSAAPAFAAVCDYKPSKLAGDMARAATATVAGGAAAAGAKLKTAGYYALAHPSSDLTMLGSTAAGTVVSGATGVGATIGGILMAPVTIAVGAVTVIGVGAFEGACYFRVERIEDSLQVRGIIESIAAHDPAVSVTETKDGPAMVLKLDKREERYLIRNLYVADGDLMHRDRFRNTNLGPVAYVKPEAENQN